MMKTQQVQSTYNQCKDCEFLEYWGFCTESICGEYCDNVDILSNHNEDSKE